MSKNPAGIADATRFLVLVRAERALFEAGATLKLIGASEFTNGLKRERAKIAARCEILQAGAYTEFARALRKSHALSVRAA